MNGEIWFPRQTAREPAEARVRLFCLPHAGGSATMYRPWRKLLPPTVDLCPIELPGRGSRFGERPFTRMSDVLDVLSEALAPKLSMPFAFFGHSMGASIGYEAALRLRRGHGPLHLFVSARAAPSAAPGQRTLHRLPDAGLLAALERFGGTPAAVLARADLMSALLPVIRADLELIETYVPSPAGILDCPITAFGGARDHTIDGRGLERWSDCTTDTFRLRLFDGDHFYLMDAPDAVVMDLTRALS